MSSISQSHNGNFIHELSSLLISHRLEPKNSAEYLKQEKKIEKLVNKATIQEADYSYFSKNDLINLRKTLFLLDETNAGVINKKISEKIQPLLTSNREKKLCMTRFSWNNFWKDYDEFVGLFPKNDVEEQFLSTVYDQFLSKRNDIAPIRKIVNETAKNNRKFLFNFLIDNCTQNDLSTDFFLKSIENIPNGERVDVIKRANSLFTKAMSGIGRSYILEAIGKIPHLERTTVIALAKSLFTQVMSSRERAYILEVLRQTPKEERVDVVKQAKSFFKDEIFEKKRSLTLRAIAEISRSERENVVKRAKLLFTHDMSDEDGPTILKMVKMIPEGERADVIKRARLFFSQDSDIESKNLILKTIQNIPKRERNDVIARGELLFTREMDSEERSHILEAIQRIPQEEREALIEQAKSLFTRGLTGHDKSYVLDTIREIPQEERQSVIEISKNFFDMRSNIQTKIKIIEQVLIIPDPERDLLKQKKNTQIINVLSKLCENKIQAMLIFYLLPSELRDYNQLSAVRNYLLNIPTYRTAIVASLEQKISNPMLPLLTQIELAEFVNTFYQQLLLHEEHHLLQQAIEILTTTDIEGPKNPFTIYKKLKELRQDPSHFHPPSQLIQGIVAEISMERLCDISSGLKITRDQLPQEVTLEAWNQLVEGFKAKMAKNEGAKEALADYGTTENSILVGSLEAPYLSGLLTLSDDKVSLAEAKFKAILSNILAKDNTKPDPFFTEQEDILIKTAMSIQNCVGGKQEGIDGAYRFLDPKYHYSVKLAEGTGEEEQKERAIGFVTEVVRNWIANQVGGNSSFMKELIGTNDIKQGVHQTIYVKNLIGHLIGLEHELMFDRHTNVLYDSLVETLRDTVLNVFFKHVTPQSMVDELTRAVNADLNENSKLVNPLVGADHWDLQDDCLTCELNQQGALRLLQVAGYIL